MNTIEEDFKIIEKFEEEIKFFVSSDLRFEILKSLFSKPSTLNILHEDTELNYTSITTNITKLESKKIISKKKDYLYLENQAKVKLLDVMLLENNLNFIYEYENFLNNHMVKNNNLKSLNILPYIGDIKLLQANNINPDIAIETIEENMMNPGRVKSVCIYSHPNYSEMIAYMMENPSDFEIVVPPHLAEVILDHANEYKTNNSIKNKRFNIKVIKDDELRIALVVSQYEAVIGLTWNEGKFNKNCVLISKEPEAIDWCYTLFNEYSNLKGEYISVRNIISENNQHEGI